MEEVLALLQAWKDNVPVSDINRREIRCGSDCSGLGCDLVALELAACPFRRCHAT